MTNNAGVFLVDARQVTRKVDKGDKRDIECIAEADKPGSLVGRIDIKHAGQVNRLVGDKTDRLAVHAAITDNQVLGEVLLNLEEFRSVSNSPDHVAYVIGQLGINRHDLIDPKRILWVPWSQSLGFLRIVPGNIGDQGFDLLKTFLLAVCKEMCVTGDCAVNSGTAELLHRDFFAKNGFNYLGASDKHF